jgi:hypothetical protein
MLSALLSTCRGAERAAFLPQVQFGRAHGDEIEHRQRRDQFGKGGADGRSDDSHAQHIDEQIVEAHVQDAHADAQEAGHFHVAAHLQHGGAHPVDLHERQGCRHDEEVFRGVGDDFRTAAQPMGERSGDGHADDADDAAEDERGQERLPEHHPGVLEVVGPDQMGDLHGKTAAARAAETAQKPHTGRYQADGRARGRPEMPHHRRVDVLHHHEGQLREDGRIAEHQAQLHLLPARQRPAIPDPPQQIILRPGFCHFERSTIVISSAVEKSI